MSCGKEKAYHAQLKLLPDFGIPHITPDSLHQILQEDQEILLLDTRSEKEWSISRLPGAQVVAFEGFQVEQLDAIPKDQPIVVYCSVGYRSGELGKKLKEQGFSKVHNLYGGILEWKNRGYAVETPEGTPTEQVHTYNSYWSAFLEKGEAVYCSLQLSDTYTPGCCRTLETRRYLTMAACIACYFALGSY